MTKQGGAKWAEEEAPRLNGLKAHLHRQQGKGVEFIWARSSITAPGFHLLWNSSVPSPPLLLLHYPAPAAALSIAPASTRLQRYYEGHSG